MTTRPAARRRRRGRAVAVVGAVVLAVGAAAAAAAVGFGGDNTGTPTAADLPPGTAQVTRQTMLDTDEVSGDLGYGAKTTLAGRIAGVVTKVPLAGDVIDRGQPIYRVDNAPVVLMYGDVAAYRTLGPGATGADVRQLEDNLKALGYGGFTADDTYSATTATAVKRWQKALGLTQTGQVEQGRVLFAPDAIRVDSVTAGVNQSTGDGQEVTVVFTAAERKDVLTVPVAALVTLAEGGYGLEVVEGSTTRYIKVETGLFANGRVEITGDGLSEGMTVGMPQ